MLKMDQPVLGKWTLLEGKFVAAKPCKAFQSPAKPAKALQSLEG